MTRIYIDMDGVLANFDERMVLTFGKHFNELGASSKERWEIISTHCQDIYSTLHPLPDADQLVTGIIDVCTEYGYIPSVLTAIPKYGRIPNAEIHKRRWIYEHWPILLENFFIGPHAVDKQLHCTPGDILIDDSHLNIPQWNAAGGIGILHTSAANSLNILHIHIKEHHGIS